ncbi:MAG: hypothetical protein Q9217_001909 [Psora testacea]
MQDAAEENAIKANSVGAGATPAPCGIDECSTHQGFKYFHSGHSKPIKRAAEYAHQYLKDQCIICLLKAPKVSSSVSAERKSMDRKAVESSFNAALVKNSDGHFIPEEEGLGPAHVLPFMSGRQSDVWIKYLGYHTSTETSAMSSIVSQGVRDVQEAVAKAVAMVNKRWTASQRWLKEEHTTNFDRLNTDFRDSRGPRQALQATLDTEKAGDKAGLEELRNQITILNDEHARQTKAKDCEIACKERAIESLRHSFDERVRENDKLRKQKEELLAQRKQLCAGLKESQGSNIKQTVILSHLKADNAWLERQLGDRIATLADLRGRLELALEPAARNFTNEYNTITEENAIPIQGVSFDDEDRDIITTSASNILGLNENGIQIRDTTFPRAAGMRLFFAEEDLEEGDLAYWYIDQEDGGGAGECNSDDYHDPKENDGYLAGDSSHDEACSKSECEGGQKGGRSLAYGVNHRRATANYRGRVHRR